jgi:hypothetical protein
MSTTILAVGVIAINGIGGAMLVIGLWTRLAASLNAAVLLLGLLTVYVRQNVLLKGTVVDAAIGRTWAGYEFVAVLAAATRAARGRREAEAEGRKEVTGAREAGRPTARGRAPDRVTPERSHMAAHWSYRIKDAYARSARAAGRALTGLGVLPRRPPDRSQRLRHWLVSLTRVHDSLAIAELDVPWWTYAAIDVVDAWLRPGPGRSGSSSSGRAPARCGSRSRVDEVHTVEHHAGFAARMRPEFAAHPHVSSMRSRRGGRPGRACRRQGRPRGARLRRLRHGHRPRGRALRPDSSSTAARARPACRRRFRISRRTVSSSTTIRAGSGTGARSRAPAWSSGALPA